MWDTTLTLWLVTAFAVGCYALLRARAARIRQRGLGRPGQRITAPDRPKP